MHSIVVIAVMVMVIVVVVVIVVVGRMRCHSRVHSLTRRIKTREKREISNSASSSEIFLLHLSF